VKIEDVVAKYNTDRLTREQALFTSIFIIQNRLQNSGERIQNELSMKQWLLLTMISVCPEPHTLSNIGRLMGCSRQNVKKLITILEKKGYVIITEGSNNSICVELTNKVNRYSNDIGKKQIELLNLLFQEFSDNEIETLFNMLLKLYSGLGYVESFSGGINYE
jgi:DNA-binding MarR family transcriptional regulator